MPSWSTLTLAVAGVERNEDAPARGAAVAVDGGHVGAHHLAVLADEKELLVRLGDALGGGYSSGLLGLEGDELDALAAPVGAPEAGDLDPLAVARLREDEHVGARPADVHAHDLVASAGESDADHPRGIAAHRPDLGLVEAGDLAQRGREQDLVLARGDLDPGHLLALVHGDGTDARRADLLELLDGRLLDRAVPRGHHQEVALLEVRDGDDRQDGL